MKRTIRLNESQLRGLIKESVRRILMENELDDVFKRQDDFKKKMIETWKTNKDLKVFDTYFKWKTGQISTEEFKNHKDEFYDMRTKAQEMLDELYDCDNLSGYCYTDSDEKNDLIDILEAIDAELTNIIIMSHEGVI